MIQTMRRSKVVESEIVVRKCDKCGKSINYGSVGVHVVQVLDVKENREECRCNNRVRGLSPRIAHKVELGLNELQGREVI